MLSPPNQAVTAEGSPPAAVAAVLAAAVAAVVPRGGEMVVLVAKAEGLTDQEGRAVATASGGPEEVVMARVEEVQVAEGRLAGGATVAVRAADRVVVDQERQVA